MSRKLIVCLIASSLLSGVYALAQLPEEYSRVLPREIKDQVPLLSAGAMRIVAKELGMKEVRGKLLREEITSGGPPPHARASFRDVPVGAEPAVIETEPSVAANPRDPRNLVAGMHFDGRCAARSSFDGGATWTGPTIMPQLSPVSGCSDPVIAFAPDGSRVLFAYMDISANFDPMTQILTLDNDIVVSYSDNGGLAWMGPSVALDGAPTRILFLPPTPPLPPPPPIVLSEGFTYDKPWISTSIDPAQSGWVYVTATRFDQAPPYLIHIAFANSADKGVAWSAPVLIDSSPDASYPPPVIVVQGSRPAGGKGGSVLVAWYHSNGPPGDPIGFGENSFLIRTRYSADHGATFGPIYNAVVDSYETPYWLGPFSSFFRWWGTVFPDVKLAADGSAHLVYTHDPAPYSETAEDGDIRYVSSAGPPYAVWTSPVTVSDSTALRAQGFASVEIRETAPRAVYVTFLDARLSPLANLLYDVYGTRKALAPGGRWQANFRISEQSSMAQYTFIGDYFDLTISGDLVYQLWTDRRKHVENFMFIPESDVFGSRVVP